MITMTKQMHIGTSWGTITLNLIKEYPANSFPYLPRTGEEVRLSENEKYRVLGVEHTISGALIHLPCTRIESEELQEEINLIEEWKIDYVQVGQNRTVANQEIGIDYIVNICNAIPPQMDFTEYDGSVYVEGVTESDMEQLNADTPEDAALFFLMDCGYDGEDLEYIEHDAQHGYIFRLKKENENEKV